MHFAVGHRQNETTSHVLVEADDALIAALIVKARKPDAMITYVRRKNKRGDLRHPHLLAE